MKFGCKSCANYITIPVDPTSYKIKIKIESRGWFTHGLNIYCPKCYTSLENKLWQSYAYKELPY